MELTWTSPEKLDLGILDHAGADFAWGSDENDFEVTLPSVPDVIPEAGSYIYADDMECGGIVDAVSTTDGTVKVSGRTWHGILGSHYLLPDADSDVYTIPAGEGATVLQGLLDDAGLSEAFRAEGDVGELASHEIGFEESDDTPVDLYTAICNWLRENACKCRFSVAADGTVTATLEEADDYTDLDSDRFSVDVALAYTPYNHVIARGTGESNSDMKRVDRYLQADGSVGEEQYFSGLDERAFSIEVSSIEEEEIAEEAESQLEEKAKSEDSAEIKAQDEEERYDMNDIVAAYDTISDVEVTGHISKVICKIDQTGTVDVSYQITREEED